ncbi:chemotaxis protein CheW [uncultured Methanoregula sp.]|uniref:chemotaxis protein CheW n=1 Tax=uncultured Methanoregula sp. TaxID=1005933 RepID=UPI002AABB3A4|nr:chemotaxis protein CheW [uncultured Methanoregula sp.]
MVQMLLFSIGENHCAIPLADTSHVIRMVRLTPLAPTFPWQAGTINLHGAIIPVLSLRTAFGIECSKPSLTDMLIIAHTAGGEIALWVDSTGGIQDIPSVSESTEIPGTEESEPPGIRKTPDGLILIHDLSRLIVMSTDPSGMITFPLQPGTEKKTLSDHGSKPADDLTADSSQIDSLLAERARRIAQPEDAASETAVMEVLKFRLAYREYALEMQYVREVILTGEITPVPGTPAYISGICVVRGEIISLVDLRVLLAIPEKGLTDLNRVIVLTNKTLSFGILADHITGIGMIELNRIDREIIPARTGYVKGIAEGSLTVLDAAALFADPKMVIEDA